MPHVGAGCRGRRELAAEADTSGQGGPVREPRQEGIGTFVDRLAPGERRRAQLAAEAVRVLPQHDGNVVCQRGGQPFGNGEPGDATPDDDDLSCHEPVAAAMTRRARAAITPLSSLTTAVRRKISPWTSARCRASTSRS